MFGVKSINEYKEQFSTSIYYGYGFSYRKNDKGMIEIKFLTRWLYPINAIVKAIKMFKSDIVWYGCEDFYETLSDADFDIWYYDYEANKNWKNWKCDNLVERYLQEYPAQKYYKEIAYVG